MQKFEVLIEETVSETFTIEAETAQEALAQAQAKYKSGEFVLTPGNILDTKISVLQNR